MKCQEIKYDFPDYVNKKVSPDVLKTIEEHLESCDSCKNEVASFIKTKSMLEAYKIPSPDERYFANFLPNLNSEIESKMNNSRIPEWVTKFVLPSASLIVAVILFMTFVRIKDDSKAIINDEEIITKSESIIETSTDILDIYSIESKIKESENYEQISDKANELLAEEILQHKEDNSLLAMESEGSIVSNLSDAEVDLVIKELKSKPILDK